MQHPVGGAGRAEVKVAKEAVESVGAVAGCKGGGGGGAAGAEGVLAHELKENKRYLLLHIKHFQRISKIQTILVLCLNTVSLYLGSKILYGTSPHLWPPLRPQPELLSTLWTLYREGPWQAGQEVPVPPGASPAVLPAVPIGFGDGGEAQVAGGLGCFVVLCVYFAFRFV